MYPLSQNFLDGFMKILQITYSGFGLKVKLLDGLNITASISTDVFLFAYVIRRYLQSAQITYGSARMDLRDVRTAVNVFVIICAAMASTTVTSEQTKMEHSAVNKLWHTQNAKCNDTHT